MKPVHCANAVPLATLLEYWLDELDEAGDARIAGHLLGCAACSANLQGLLDLAGGVRAAMQAGLLQVVVPDAFLERLAARGLRVREYAVAPSGSVNCTVGPDDDLVVARLGASLAGVGRLDIEQASSTRAQVERMRDVPFDSSAAAVILAANTGQLRALPASTLRIRLLDVAPAGERLLGEYTFHHSPHPGAGRH